MVVTQVPSGAYIEIFLSDLWAKLLPPPRKTPISKPSGVSETYMKLRIYQANFGGQYVGCPLQSIT